MIKRKILIATGGTGGHLYPAIVLARELRKRDCEILFTLKANMTAPKEMMTEEFSVAPIQSAPFSRKNMFKNAPAAFSVLKGFCDSLKIIGRFKPDVTVGFGGYASVPVVLASAMKGVPVFLHEQNVVPGVANRICARFAFKIAVSFEETLRFFSKKSILVGNLIRSDFFNPDRDASLKSLNLDGTLKTILVFGGSAGARPVNQAVSGMIGRLKDSAGKIQFIHQTGNDEDTAKLKKLYRDHGFRAVVQNYFTQMNDCYAASDLVISRAGASAVTELAASEKPAILIPYPYAASDHQAKNAEVTGKIGACIVLHESPDLEKRLAETVRELLESPEKLVNMKNAYKNFSINLKESPAKMADLVLSGVQ